MPAHLPVRRGPRQADHQETAGGEGATVAVRAPLPGVVVGAKSVLRALEAAAVRRVLVAADAPDTATAPVRRSAAARGVAVVTVVSAVELGRRCGIARPVAAAAEHARPDVAAESDVAGQAPAPARR